MEHLQIGKQIGKFLDMPKGPQAQKQICWVWNMKMFKKTTSNYVRNEAMVVLVFIVFGKMLVFVFFGENWSGF